MAEYTETRIRTDEDAAVFLVDSVNEVADITEEEIFPPPKMASREQESPYLTGIGKHAGTVILLIHTQRMLGGTLELLA